MYRRTILLATLGLLGGSLSSLQGALGPGEFQVNTYTTGDQKYPAVAMDDAGNFVVVWQSDGQLGSNLGSDIFGQRFAPNGARIGGEFQVNTDTAGPQVAPAVALHPTSGKFMVVWTGLDDAGSGLRTVRAQLFDAAGKKAGAEFQVNKGSTLDQQEPAVGVDWSSGNFVVVWDNRAEVLGQMFDSSGNRLGGGAPIAISTGGLDSHPTVAVDGAGNFVVAWSNGEIEAQRVDRTGNLMGSQIRVPGEDVDNLFPSMAAAPAGNFVIAWETDYYWGSQPVYSGRASAFDASGAPAGGNGWVGSTTQSAPKVATDRSKGFILVWESGPRGFTGIAGQPLDAGAMPKGPVIQISSGTGRSPAIASSIAGKAAVVWIADDLEHTGDIVGRIVDLDSGSPCLRSDPSSCGPSPCEPSPNILCLDAAPGDKRFKVEITYSTIQAGGLSGSALAVPLASVGFTSAGLFAFADPGTPDVMVKLLDACSFAHSRWFFLSGSTNFGFNVTVTDTLTGVVRVYFNPDLTLVSPVADFAALPCP